jgi:hypothetical protein
MRAFVNCVIAYLSSFLGDLGWIALALLVACILAGLATGPGGVAIFALCLKAAGIGLAGAVLIAIGDAIRTCS